MSYRFYKSDMDNNDKDIRAMFICNEGGHYSQMMALRELWSCYDSVLVTDNQKADSTRLGIEVCHARQLTQTGFLRKRIARVLTLGEAAKIYRRYRPQVMISTGANLALPLFFIGKLHGCRLIYIESRARVYSRSLTGKIISRIVDKMIVQWPEQVALYKGKVEYHGTLV